MALIVPVEELKSIAIRRKFSKPNQYGEGIYGISNYGHEQDAAGIYQVRTRFQHRANVKEKFYEPAVQNQPNKVARQIVFAAAVAAWQSLTEEQKIQYNIKSKGKHMSAYNVFLREYLFSH